MSERGMQASVYRQFPDDSVVIARAMLLPGVAIADGELGTEAGQRQRSRLADALRGAGHDRDAISEQRRARIEYAAVPDRWR